MPEPIDRAEPPAEGGGGPEGGGGRPEPERAGPPAMQGGLDREQLDRVIRRATELQFAGSDPELHERLSEKEVIRIGREVGLEPRHVARAIGEVRAQSLVPSTEERGLAAALIGPARVAAARIVPGRAKDRMSALEEYLRTGESLRQVRRRGERMRWEPDESLAAAVQRGLKWGGRKYDLARAGSLEVAVEEVGEGLVLVSLDADVSPQRTRDAWGWGLGLTAGGGAIGAGVGAAMAMPVLGIPAAAVGAAAGWQAARRDQARFRERIRTAMEGILDRLEAELPLEPDRLSIKDRWFRL